MEKIQKFFLEIREGDEDAKKRWLVILTSLSMIFVLALWSAYISISIPQIGSPEKKVENDNFTSTISNVADLAAKNIGLKLSAFADKLGSLARRTNSITIEGASFNFTASGLQEVTPKKLP